MMRLESNAKRSDCSRLSLHGRAMFDLDIDYRVCKRKLEAHRNAVAHTGIGERYDLWRGPVNDAP